PRSKERGIAQNIGHQSIHDLASTELHEGRGENCHPRWPHKLEAHSVAFKRMISAPLPIPMKSIISIHYLKLFPCDSYIKCPLSTSSIDLSPNPHLIDEHHRPA